MRYKTRVRKITCLDFSGKTYFFKNKGFWKLNDMRMKAENEHPLPSAAFWMNCSNYDIGHIPTKTKIHKKWSRLEAAPPVTAGSLTTSSKMPVYVILFLFHLLPRWVDYYLVYFETFLYLSFITLVIFIIFYVYICTYWDNTQNTIMEAI